MYDLVRMDVRLDVFMDVRLVVFMDDFNMLMEMRLE
jgi:hypothetical protein